MSVDRQAQGFVLIGVLVVVMLASMVVVSLMYEVRAEQTAFATTADGEQAYLAAMSGIQRAMLVAETDRQNDQVWRHNPGLFYQQLVHDDGGEQWHFTVYRPAGEGGGLAGSGLTGVSGLWYGIEDEASKLNINQLHTPDLLPMEGMTPELVAALRDYIDPDLDQREEGAEQEWYDEAGRTYRVRNGPLTTLEELRMVRGYSLRTLYGEDANQNFQLDPNEDDGDGSFPPDNGDGVLDRGWSAQWTVWSYDPNVSNKGEKRWNLKDGLTKEHRKELGPPFDSDDTINQYFDDNWQADVKFTHVAELATAPVIRVVTADNVSKELELSLDLTPPALGMLLDRATFSDADRQEGLVNINTASARVLQSIDGIDRALADSIVSRRDGLGPEKRRSVVWLLEEQLVDRELFKRIAPRLTTRSFQFRVRSIGYGVKSGRFRVLEAVIDTVGGSARVVYLRDLTRLGLPFAIRNEEGVQG